MEARPLVALVTGATNSVGRAIAERLRDDGFAVGASHLVAADNTYLTGQRVVVDGGLLSTF